jgi:23S rRNA (uracil1939-C5)-methyltransferase/tRNA (uracil-5-)-methyltransferase
MENRVGVLGNRGIQVGIIGVEYCRRPVTSSGVGRKKTFNNLPFEYHQEIELEISTLTNLGLGLGRVQLVEGDERSWVVMVPFALPGERVKARIYRNQKNFSEADLVEVLRAAPDRVEPRCPLYGRCGGCQYQHLSYQAQLDWKRRQVEELLQHMAGVIHPVNPVIGSPVQYGYRSKITPHFHCGKAAGDEEQQKAMAEKLPIGFLRQGTRFDLVDVPRCEIATDPINARLGPVRAELRAKVARGEFQRGATLLLRDAGGEVYTDYEARISESVGELKLSFLARDFFQNNPFILPAFTGYVRERARESGARSLVDAYCGSGLFALSCAPAFERVAGVEISESSIQFAEENAKANGIANTTFLAGDASAIFDGLDFDPANTVTVIDPPRKGCDESFLQQLFRFGPKAVVYVSCDPATQMRDLRFFFEAGYRIRDVQPFDLFPQTRHLECVVTLEKTPAQA